MTKPYRIGYCRTSTKEQNLDLQRDALAQAGCSEVFEEQASGAKRDRPRLAEALARLRRGDCLAVWKIDRLARSVSHLLEIVEGLDARGIEFYSITEGFDTRTPGGKAFFTICGAMAEMERGLIRERIEAGVKAARDRGVKFGRKPADHPEKVAKLKKARDYIDQGLKVGEAAKLAGLSRSTVYKYLGEAENEPNKNGQQKRTVKRVKMTNGTGHHAAV